jgi:E3 ubiquitin-protein ligase DOA10
MKASDSVNSLTELNPSEPSCFICLSTDIEEGEPLVDSKLLRNCGCKFHVHPACWNQWMKSKSDYDCPMCHKSSMMRINIQPNPVLNIVYQEEQRSAPTKIKLLLCMVILGITCLLVASIVLWG